eukprot:jgi/Pico_ML_1/51567/g2569.t1
MPGDAKTIVLTCTGPVDKDVLERPDVLKAHGKLVALNKATLRILVIGENVSDKEQAQWCEVANRLAGRKRNPNDPKRAHVVPWDKLHTCKLEFVGASVKKKKNVEEKGNAPAVAELKPVRGASSIGILPTCANERRLMETCAKVKKTTAVGVEVPEEKRVEVVPIAKLHRLAKMFTTPLVEVAVGRLETAWRHQGPQKRSMLVPNQSRGALTLCYAPNGGIQLLCTMKNPKGFAIEEIVYVPEGRSVEEEDAEVDFLEGDNTARSFRLTFHVRGNVVGPDTGGKGACCFYFWLLGKDVGARANVDPPPLVSKDETVPGGPPSRGRSSQVKERKAVVQELEYRMTKAILREQATEHVRLKDVRDGTAVLEVLGQFQVQLTLCTSPIPNKRFHWKVIRVEHTGSLSLPQDEGETLSMLGFEVEQRMNANHAPLLAMCAMLGDLTAMLTLQSVKQYGHRTKQGKGSQHVHVALEAQRETHATETVCFHLWTCQRDKRRILRLWATPTGSIAGALRLDPIAGEGPSCTLDVPPDRGTAREALSWALDACGEDLLESVDARLRPRGVPWPVGEEGHALFARGSSPRRCRSAGGAREASLVLTLSTHGRLHIGVERLTGKLIVEGKEGPSTHLASKLQRLLQKERNTELSSVQIDAAIRALFLEAGLERLKQTFQLHGLSPVEGPSTPQRAELEHASSVYYRLPGWGSSQAPVLLQATLDPWGHPMPEEFALHLPSGRRALAVLPGARCEEWRAYLVPAVPATLRRLGVDCFDDKELSEAGAGNDRA